jgi:hypothetical protein
MREAEVLNKARQSGTEAHIQGIAKYWDIDPETIRWHAGCKEPHSC